MRFSKRFCHQDHPLPSQKIILSRSFRFDLKTKTLPQYGSTPNACATIATKPWTPQRKSIGRDATNTFKSLRRHDHDPRRNTAITIESDFASTPSGTRTRAPAV
jgi:hypothetical protein